MSKLCQSMKNYYAELQSKSNASTQKEVILMKHVKLCKLSHLIVTALPARKDTKSLQGIFQTFHFNNARLNAKMWHFFCWCELMISSFTRVTEFRVKIWQVYKSIWKINLQKRISENDLQLTTKNTEKEQKKWNLSKRSMSSHSAWFNISL